MNEIELELTYLAKELPKDLKKCTSKEIIDIYFPKDVPHSVLRLRKNGDKYQMTKKEPIDGQDSSRMLEQTIILNELEFHALKVAEGKKVRKQRYYLPFQGFIAEVDVFKDALEGLVLIDFEFKNDEEKLKFEMPPFLPRGCHAGRIHRRRNDLRKSV
jgi:CYTH domain-containing protein